MAGTDLNKLDAMTDADIDYSDIPELPDDFAEQAEWFSDSGQGMFQLALTMEQVRLKRHDQR